MNDLAILMKINILNLIGYNKFKNSDKKEKKKIIITTMLIVLSIMIFGGYLLAFCFYISELLMQVNQIDLLLIIGIVGGSSITFFRSLYKASSFIFQSKEYETLTSLPIKQSIILSSKILMLVLNNYLFSSAFVLIPGIVYFIKMKMDLVYIINLLILNIFTPIIPVLIASLFAFFITNISSKSKNTNLVSIILNLVIVVTVMLLSFNIEDLIIKLVKNSESIISATQKIYLPAYYFLDVLKNSNIMSLLIFLGISLLLTVIFIFIFSNIFNKINSKLTENYKSNNYEFKEMKISKPLISLLKKEFKRYLSSTVYVMNKTTGMILLPMLTIAIIFVGYDKIATLLELSILEYFMKMQITMIVAFCIIISNTSCVSISLEGKNLWLLKSLFIDEIDIFKSKILLNALLTIPISITCFIAISIKLNFELYTIYAVILLIILLSIFSATLGLFVNLLYPKLDYTSEVQVVKQGASTIIALIGNILYIIIICLIGYIIKITNFDTFVMIANVIIFITTLFLWGLLKTKGVKLFRNLR